LIPESEKNSPRVLIDKLTRFVNDESIDFKKKNMTAEQRIDLKDYVEARMQLWEPKIGNSFALQI